MNDYCCDAGDSADEGSTQNILFEDYHSNQEALISHKNRISVSKDIISLLMNPRPL